MLGPRPPNPPPPTPRAGLIAGAGGVGAAAAIGAGAGAGATGVEGTHSFASGLGLHSLALALNDDFFFSSGGPSPVVRGAVVTVLAGATVAGAGAEDGAAAVPRVATDGAGVVAGGVGTAATPAPTATPTDAGASEAVTNPEVDAPLDVTAPPGVMVPLDATVLPAAPGTPAPEPKPVAVGVVVPVPAPVPVLVVLVTLLVPEPTPGLTRVPISALMPLLALGFPPAPMPDASPAAKDAPDFSVLVIAAWLGVGTTLLASRTGPDIAAAVAAEFPPLVVATAGAAGSADLVDAFAGTRTATTGTEVGADGANGVGVDPEDGFAVDGDATGTVAVGAIVGTTVTALLEVARFATLTALVVDPEP